MFACAGISFVIYGLVFLKMRGNLVGHGLNTRLKFIPRSESWKLKLSRDEIDRNMFGVVQTMVWWAIFSFVWSVDLTLSSGIPYVHQTLLVRRD